MAYRTYNEGHRHGYSDAQSGAPYAGGTETTAAYGGHRRTYDDGYRQGWSAGKRDLAEGIERNPYTGIERPPRPPLDPLG